MDLEIKAKEIINELNKYSFQITEEKLLQNDLFNVLKKFNVHKEHRLDEKSTIDFFVDGIGIEVKIKGQRVAIYKQCERYCQHIDIKVLILVTKRFMGFPKNIKDKPAYLVHLSRNCL